MTALTEGARGGANLLALSVEAARAKATVGEISLAMETGVRPPRRRGASRSPASISPKRATATDANRRVIAMTAAFAENDGRRPRILVAKMGQDGHDRGQKIIASAFADLGFEVEIGPLFATPEEVAALAAEKRVHIVGVSSLAAGHLALAPALKAALGGVGLGEALVVIGGVVPRAGFRGVARRRRRRDLPARHGDRRGGAEPDGTAQPADAATSSAAWREASRLTGAAWLRAGMLQGNRPA